MKTLFITQIFNNLQFTHYTLRAQDRVRSQREGVSEQDINTTLRCFPTHTYIRLHLNVCI